jgi:hypothetical protein
LLQAIRIIPVEFPIVSDPVAAGLGWAEGRNLRIDTRWGGGDAARSRKTTFAHVG